MTITLVTDSNTWQYWQEEWNRGKEVNPKHKASPDWSPGIDVIFLFLCLVRVVVRGEVYVHLKLVNCALGQNWLSEIFVHFQKINSENWFGSTDRLMVWFSKNKQTSNNYRALNDHSTAAYVEWTRLTNTSHAHVEWTRFNDKNTGMSSARRRKEEMCMSS